MSEKIKLDLAEKSYEIIVGAGVLAKAAEYIKPKVKSKKLIIVTDENVVKRHLKKFTESLVKAGFEVRSQIIPAGEKQKSFVRLENLVGKILASGVDRKTTLIAFGGGVVGDLTGFAASIILRGIDFIQIPTTLLSMVDSSVGGKTGINTAQGKNLVGSFYQPKLVLADIDLLKTLPKRELLAGYAEVVKYALIEDEKFFNWLSDNIEKIKKLDKAALTKAVVTSCKAKAAIVARDEKETGDRALLNLGHTFGHALETEAKYKDIVHGEAVAIGMQMAFDFSVFSGICKNSDAEKLSKHLKKVGLKTDIKFYPSLKKATAEKLLAHMRKDKKVSDGKLTFILAKAIGKSFVVKDVDAKQVLKFLKQEV